MALFVDLVDGSLWPAALPLKSSLDLLEHLTAEDIAQIAEANVHRFKPEPFSFTRYGPNDK